MCTGGTHTFREIRPQTKNPLEEESITPACMCVDSAGITVNKKS